MIRSGVFSTSVGRKVHVYNNKKDVGAECRHGMRSSVQLPSVIRPNNGLDLAYSRRLNRGRVIGRR